MEERRIKVVNNSNFNGGKAFEIPIETAIKMGFVKKPKIHEHIALRGGMASTNPTYKACIGCMQKPYCAGCTKKYRK